MQTTLAWAPGPHAPAAPAAASRRGGSGAAPAASLAGRTPPPRLPPAPPRRRTMPAAAAAAAASDADPAAADIPASLEAAVSAAASGWAAALGAGATGRLLGSARPAAALSASPSPSSRGKKGGGFAGTKKGKAASKAAPTATTPSVVGFRGGPPARATLEVPAADASPAGVAAVALAIAKALPFKPPAGLTLCFGDVDAALAASDAASGWAAAGLTITALGEEGEDEEGGGDGGPSSCLGPPGSAVLVVAPGVDQAAGLGTLLTSTAAGGGAARDVALLNPAWSEGGGGPGGPLPPGLPALTPAYAFIPIAISGFLGLPGDTGALVFTPPGPWRIYKEGSGGGRGGSFSLVGRSAARPTSRDLEDAFYNAAAAGSPLTKGAAALKGLADRVTGKKGGEA